MQYIPVLNTVGMEILYQFERRWCKLKKINSIQSNAILIVEVTSVSNNIFYER